jgi:hypothetical protein
MIDQIGSVLIGRNLATNGQSVEREGNGAELNQVDAVNLDIQVAADEWTSQSDGC